MSHFTYTSLRTLKCVMKSLILRENLRIKALEITVKDYISGIGRENLSYQSAAKNRCTQTGNWVIRTPRYALIIQQSDFKLWEYWLSQILSFYWHPRRLHAKNYFAFEENSSNWVSMQNASALATGYQERKHFESDTLSLVGLARSWRAERRSFTFSPPAHGLFLPFGCNDGHLIRHICSIALLCCTSILELQATTKVLIFF